MLMGYKGKQQKGGTYHDFLHRSVFVGRHIRSVVRNVAACQQQVQQQVRGARQVERKSRLNRASCLAVKQAVTRTSP
jgi:hypothetical protein